MDLRRTSAWIALRLFWVVAVVAAALALWSRPVPACELPRAVNGGLGGSGLTLVALKVIG
jgi:hypothetical protein